MSYLLKFSSKLTGKMPDIVVYDTLFLLNEILMMRFYYSSCKKFRARMHASKDTKVDLTLNFRGWLMMLIFCTYSWGIKGFNKSLFYGVKLS